MLKTTFLILSASLPLLASADEATDYNQVCCVLPPEPVESCQLPVGIFYPALYPVKDSGVVMSVAGEFIYWQVNPDSLEQIASKITGTFAPGTVTTIDSLSHYQGYRPGFRVGAGIALPCLDQWEIDMEYTWFHHETSKTFDTTNNQFIVSKFIPHIYYVASSSLKSERRMNLNYLDGVVGKSFYLSQRFLVKASCGLKGWWASEKQDLRFNVFTGAIGTQTTKVSLWGIGPYVKANIKALLWCGTYIQGKAGVYTTYTRQNKFHSQTNFPPVPGFGFPGFIDSERETGKNWLVRLFYEGGVALGWGTYFCDNGYHADFSVGWDLMTNYVGPYGVIVGNHLKAFYSQGLSVRAQLDF